MQVHGAREVCAEGAGVVHLDVRQVDADRAKDAAPLGRGKHAGKENFSSSIFDFCIEMNPAFLPSGQMLQVQEADQELQRHHRAALPMVSPHGERERLSDSSLTARSA